MTKPSPIAILAASDCIPGTVFGDGSRLSLVVPTRKAYFLHVGCFVFVKDFGEVGVPDGAAIIVGLSDASTATEVLTRIEVAKGRPSIVAEPPKPPIDWLAINRSSSGG